MPRSSAKRCATSQSRPTAAGSPYSAGPVPLCTFAPLLAPLPLADMLVTANAEHCQRAHARFLVYDKDADYLLVAKGTQPGLEAHAASELPGGFSPSGWHV
ncbi:MAG: hypothetical protein EXS40_07085 [Opitutaceae bacterium]|nr:hypothetical protein [Opitutaceae bacterium]